MMKISHLLDDAIRLRFVPFALKDLAKKWLYSLAADSITSWVHQGLLEEILSNSQNLSH